MSIQTWMMKLTGSLTSCLDPGDGSLFNYMPKAAKKHVHEEVKQGIGMLSASHQAGDPEKVANDKGKKQGIQDIQDTAQPRQPAA